MPVEANNTGWILSADTKRPSTLRRAEFAVDRHLRFTSTAALALSATAVPGHGQQGTNHL